MNQKDFLSGHSFNFSRDMMKDVIEIQKQRSQNEARELQLKEKELELGAKYSEKVLDRQTDYMARMSLENRKTFTRLGWVIGLVLFVILTFLTIWVWLGKEEFAFKFMYVAGYGLSTIVGYWLGNRTRRNNPEQQHEAPQSSLALAD